MPEPIREADAARGMVLKLERSGRSQPKPESVVRRALEVGRRTEDRDPNLDGGAAGRELEQTSPSVNRNPAERSLVWVLYRLALLGLTLRVRAGRLTVFPAGRLSEGDLEAMRPWANVLRKIARRPLSPWRSLSLARAFEGAPSDWEQRLVRLIEVFGVNGVGDHRDPTLFPAGRQRYRGTTNPRSFGG